MPKVTSRRTPQLARCLREARRRVGLSRKDVANLSSGYPASISASFLAKAEQGLHSPHAAVLLSLSSIYHVPVELLMEELRLDLWSDDRATEQDAEVLHAEGRDRLLRNDIEGARWFLLKALDGYKLLMAGGADESTSFQYQQLCMDLSISLVRSGLRHTSESYLKRVLEPPTASKKLRAYALYYLGIVYVERGTRELARSVVRSALEFAESMADEGLKLSCMTVLADIDRAEGRLLEARRSHEYCWAAFEALGQVASAAIAQASYGYDTVQLGIQSCDLEMISSGLGAQRQALRSSAIAGDAPRSCRMRISYGLSLLEAGSSGVNGSDGYVSRAKTELGRANRLARDLKLVLLDFDSRYYLLRAVRQLGGKERPHLEALARLRPKLPASTPEAREYDQWTLSK